MVPFLCFDIEYSNFRNAANFSPNPSHMISAPLLKTSTVFDHWPLLSYQWPPTIGKFSRSFHIDDFLSPILFCRANDFFALQILLMNLFPTVQQTGRLEDNRWSRFWWHDRPNLALWTRLVWKNVANALFLQSTHVGNST